MQTLTGLNPDTIAAELRHRRESLAVSSPRRTRRFLRGAR